MYLNEVVDTLQGLLAIGAISCIIYIIALAATDLIDWLGRGR
jgi:hypothetical protein